LDKKEKVTDGKSAKDNSCILRNFKAIYEQDPLNKVKNEFRDLNLKTKIKIDDQYLVNLKEIGNNKEGQDL
jgi:hypothetical protein